MEFLRWRGIVRLGLQQWVFAGVRVCIQSLELHMSTATAVATTLDTTLATAAATASATTLAATALTTIAAPAVVRRR